MRCLSLVALLLAGCELYQHSPSQGDDYVPIGPTDAGPACNACPAQESWGQACEPYQAGAACLYNNGDVCACIGFTWRCGTVHGIDAGLPDAAIPPDAP
jgi:hypothetical protein